MPRRRPRQPLRGCRLCCIWENCLSKVNCLTMVVTFDLVSPVFRLFSSQKLKTKTCYSKCAGASQTLRTQAPAALGGCKCSATHARLTPASRSANLVCDVTGLSVFYVVSACPILRGRAARFSRAQLKFSKLRCRGSPLGQGSDLILQTRKKLWGCIDAEPNSTCLTSVAC